MSLWLSNDEFNTKYEYNINKPINIRHNYVVKCGGLVGLPEVACHKQLKHPCIIPMLHFTYICKQNKLVMAFPKGEVMHNFTYSYDTIIQVVWDLIQAIAYMHRQGFVHGDIKPHNMVCYENRFCFIDLGVSRLISVNDDKQQCVIGVMNCVDFRDYTAAKHPSINLDYYAIGKLILWMITKRTYTRNILPDIGWYEYNLSNNTKDQCMALMKFVNRVAGYPHQRNYCELMFDPIFAQQTISYLGIRIAPPCVTYEPDVHMPIYSGVCDLIMSDSNTSLRALFITVFNCIRFPNRHLLSLIICSSYASWDRMVEYEKKVAPTINYTDIGLLLQESDGNLLLPTLWDYSSTMSTLHDHLHIRKTYSCYQLHSTQLIIYASWYKCFIDPNSRYYNKYFVNYDYSPVSTYPQLEAYMRGFDSVNPLDVAPIWHQITGDFPVKCYDMLVKNMSIYPQLDIVINKAWAIMKNERK
jgi:serine/threonine protein kinase